MEFLEIKKGDRFTGTTIVKQTETGDKVIQTEIVESITISEDPGEMNLQVGRANRGSLLPFVTDDGRIALRFNPFKQRTAQQPAPENLHKTDHGRIYQNAKLTRIVFEFPVNTSFGQISDALDDEVYELRSFLDKNE